MVISAVAVTARQEQDYPLTERQGWITIPSNIRNNCDTTPDF